MNNRGSLGLLEIMIGGALIGITVATVLRLSALYSGVIESNREYLETASFMHLVRSSINCCKTLGITETTSLPVTCDSTNLRLLDASGQVINTNLGKWELNAVCDKNEIVVKAKKRSKMYSHLNREEDFFSGVSNFCSKCYAGSATYQKCCYSN